MKITIALTVVGTLIAWIGTGEQAMEMQKLTPVV